ncbi:MAG TPA: glutamyl-tRNA reductase, partial [Halieaceae bacterium]|nr:glutamyl-tRNA reductase [Halieaceae bacterium]
QTEARKADQLIEEGVSQYLEELRSLAAVDSVRQYRDLAESIRELELQRALRALARGDDPQQIVAQLARGITNKLIHAPTAGLKRASAEGRQDLLAGARRLLGLEGAGPANHNAGTDEPADGDATLPVTSQAQSRVDRTLQ